MWQKLIQRFDREFAGRQWYRKLRKGHWQSWYHGLSGVELWYRVDCWKPKRPWFVFGVGRHEFWG